MDNVALENLRIISTLWGPSEWSLNKISKYIMDNVTMDNVVLENLYASGTLDVTGAATLGSTLDVAGKLTVTDNISAENVVTENLTVTNYICPTFIQRGDNTYQVTSATNLDWFSMDCYYPTAWGSGEIPNVVVTAENLDAAGCGIVTIDDGSVTESKFTVLIKNVGPAVIDSYVKVHWIAVYT